MPFVRNAWYVAALPEEIESPALARTVLEVPLVLFRQATRHPPPCSTSARTASPPCRMERCETVSCNAPITASNSTDRAAAFTIPMATVQGLPLPYPGGD